MDANDSFEEAADCFYKATGHLMPGKSIAAAAYAGEEAEEERQKLFKVWCAAISYMNRPNGVLAENAALKSKLDAANRVVEAAERYHDHETNICGDELCLALKTLAALTPSPAAPRGE